MGNQIKPQAKAPTAIVTCSISIARPLSPIEFLLPPVLEVLRGQSPPKYPGGGEWFCCPKQHSYRLTERTRTSGKAFLELEIVQISDNYLDYLYGVIAEITAG
ncbi:hypothetical protein [Synechococcus sp. PCC 7336]|uniref:hypothetical protein n=1 Tax=Synechococcus sp. PCC 7336 TaxID=195250 RepID=UPI0012E9B214|nr:hypothetical protein [Synechococcus sp. PCC 7336]